MAQTGFTPIQVYRSATPGATPTASNLAAGELALNTADEKIFFKNASGTVVSIATGAGTGSVTSVSGTGTVNGLTLTGTVTTSGSLTLGGTLSNVSLTTQVTGTLPVANGGTGVTTSTGTGSVVRSSAPSLSSPTMNNATATGALNIGTGGSIFDTTISPFGTGILIAPTGSACAFATGTSFVVTTSRAFVVQAPPIPSSASDTGTTGTIAWDSNYIYVCVATNTWKRVAISTWP